MRKTTTILLPLAGMLLAASSPALSDPVAPKVFTGGTGATTKAVNIFQPVSNLPPADSIDESPIIVLNKTIVIYNIKRPGHETRAQRRKRAIGHRYLGFIKQYRGYRYPF